MAAHDVDEAVFAADTAGFKFSDCTPDAVADAADEAEVAGTREEPALRSLLVPPVAPAPEFELELEPFL